MDHVTSGAIARLLALALTAHPVEGGSTPLTSAPVLAEAMYSSFVVDGMSDVRGNFPMHHCSPESTHQSTIAAWLRVRPAYAKDGFPLLLETNGRCSSTKTPLISSSPAPDTTTTRASSSFIGLELEPPIARNQLRRWRALLADTRSIK